MATPLKTQILNRIKTLLGGVSGIGKVFKEEPVPIKRDLAPWDIVYLFTEEESSEERNRIILHRLPIHIEIWANDQRGMEYVSDKVDVYQAEINKSMLADATLNALINKITEGTSGKFFEAEDVGGIILLYEIQFSHRYGDPYAPARS